MSREIDEAQRRIDTGWRIKLSPRLNIWCVWKDADVPVIAGFYNAESEARAAYLAVTAPCSKP